MKNIFGIGTALLAATLLGSCGGSSSGLPSGTPEANQAAAVVAVPGLSSTANFSFDLGMVVNGKYYLTDRNNKAVDVVDVTTLQITQIIPTGTLAFAGVSPAGNGKSGPDGINFISSTGQIYVGDVDGVKVVTGNTVTGSIRVGTTGFRADEGCFDPDHNIYMISTPDADTPFASFINAANGTLMATVMSIDTNGSPMGGNEQCQYDHGSQSFLVNNDGTIANPHGEVDVIPVAAIQALARGSTTNALSIAGLKRFPLGNCDPTGMDLGPGIEVAVMCRPGDAGSPLVTLIMNRNTGAVVATVPFGGGDQLAYDARTNRYYLTGNRWRPSGRNDPGGGCTATALCTPTLTIVDASTHAIVAMIATGNNAHSVAVDPATGAIFVPHSSSAAPVGCATCTANGFINPGIAVFFSPS